MDDAEKLSHALLAGLCPACGGAGKRATARTANGRDLERHELHGTPCQECGGSGQEHPYTILVADQVVWADEEKGALLAAITLVREASEYGGASSLLRAEVIIARDGKYDARLTNAARSGRSNA